MLCLWLYNNIIDYNNIIGPQAVSTTRGKQPSMGTTLGLIELLSKFEMWAVMQSSEARLQLTMSNKICPKQDISDHLKWLWKALEILQQLKLPGQRYECAE